jgi:hypothetical protein
MTNSDNFGPSLFPLYRRKKGTKKEERMEEGAVPEHQLSSEKKSGDHAQSLVHVDQRRAGHSQIGVDHLGREVGRVLVIQVNDALKDAAIDDPVRASLLLLPLPGLLVHRECLESKAAHLAMALTDKMQWEQYTPESSPQAQWMACQWVPT